METNKQQNNQIIQEKVCFHCKNTSQHLFLCKCGKSYCCSEHCQENCAMKHIKICNDCRGLVNFSQNDLKQSYLDSCLICLFHTTPLRQYLLSASQDFSQQKCTKKYFPIISSLIEILSSFWKQTKPERLHELRNFVQNVKKNANNHKVFPFDDANQTLKIIFDLFDQALNRVKKKNYLQKQQLLFSTDNQQVQYKWLSHLSSVRSITTDLFTGLVQQRIKCRSCLDTSVFYETFSFVCLPIPYNIGFLQVRVIYCQFGKSDESIFINYTKPLGELIEKDAIDKLGENKQQFVLFLLSQEGLIFKAKIISEEYLQLEKIFNKTFLIQYSAEQKRIGKKSFLACSFWNNSERDQNKKRIGKFKMPFFIDLQNSTGVGIHKKILKFLYSKAYHNKKKRMINGFKGHSYEQFEEMFYAQKWGKISLFKIKVRIVNEEKLVIYDEEKEFDCKIETNIYLALKSMFPSEEEFDSFIKSFEIRVFLDQNRFQFGKIFANLSINRTDQTKKELGIKLQDCLKTFAREQTIGTKQQPIWQCPKCEQKAVATTMHYLYQTPEILIFTLDRFQNTKQKVVNFNRSSVQFLFSLDLSNFVKNGSSMMSRTQSRTNHPITFQKTISVEEKNIPKYNLYAFIAYQNQGEYISYINVREAWFQFKNQVAFPLKSLQGLQQYAYILFYQRC